MKRLILKPTELQKAKYIKRWKGPDGKWRYSYGPSRYSKSPQFKFAVEAINKDGLGLLQRNDSGSLGGYGLRLGRDLVLAAIDASDASPRVKNKLSRELDGAIQRRQDSVIGSHDSL